MDKQPYERCGYCLTTNAAPEASGHTRRFSKQVSLTTKRVKV
jgi:hypothetical protein